MSALIGLALVFYRFDVSPAVEMFTSVKLNFVQICW